MNGGGTIDQITPHQLWVGHVDDGRDFAGMHALGIEAVVQLAVEEQPLILPRAFLSHRIPLLDGPGNSPIYLAMAVEAVAALLRARIPTLVCCGMGLSRSPAIAASALARVNGCSLDDSLRTLAACHLVDISPGFWNEVRAIVSDR